MDTKVRKSRNEIQQRRKALDLTLRQIGELLGCTAAAVCYAEHDRSHGRVWREYLALLQRLEAEQE